MAVSQKSVFILGWMGAKAKHMQQVTQLYQGLKLDVQVHVTSPSEILGIRDDRDRVHEMYRKAEGKSILCHMFSMNGMLTFYRIFGDRGKNLRPDLNIKGLIMDSTPGRVNGRTFHQAYGKAMFPHSDFLAACTSAAVAPFIHAYSWLSPTYIREKEDLIKSIYNNPVKAPTLLLGSAKDHLVSPKDMLDYVDAAREAGVDVKSKIWDDSGHIRLFRDHSSEYRSIVRNFAQKTLFEE